MLLTTSKELILITGKCSYPIQIDMPYPDLLEKRAVSKKLIHSALASAYINY